MLLQSRSAESVLSCRVGTVDLDYVLDLLVEGVGDLDQGRPPVIKYRLQIGL